MNRVTKGPDDRPTAITALGLLIAAMVVVFLTGLFKLWRLGKL